MRGRALLAALVVGLWTAAAAAEIIVNDPLPISRRVTVQLIQTALDSGTSPATVFGNGTQRAYIEAAIDTIWAQAGIDVAFLPTVNRYNDTFAYQGTDGDDERSPDDFGTIFDEADDQGGILSADLLTLNLILVRVVPDFEPLGPNTAAGYARVRGNGMIGYVGASLLTFGDGRDVIASVMAHEIGHNLGLNHTASGQPNLMSPGGSTEHLDASQIGIARSSSFARMIAAQLAGDYNRDGIVDAADYTLWRNTLGQVATGLPADGNNNGRIDEGDYTVWRTNYGAGGTGATAVIPGAGITGVPEPNSFVYTVISAVVLLTVRRRMPC